MKISIEFTKKKEFYTNLCQPTYLALKIQYLNSANSMPIFDILNSQFPIPIDLRFR